MLTKDTPSILIDPRSCNGPSGLTPYAVVKPVRAIDAAKIGAAHRFRMSTEISRILALITSARPESTSHAILERLS